MSSYEDIATRYAEKKGIIEYTVVKNKMVYYADYPKYLSLPRRTFKIVVNLDDFKEESRTQLKRCNGKGVHNRYK